MGMGSLGWLQLSLQRSGWFIHAQGTTAAMFSLAVSSAAAKGREGVQGTWLLLWFEVCLFAWWLSQPTWLLWASLLTGCTENPLCVQRMEVKHKENKEIPLLP